jgi:nucleotide-binding universal stress UspA family protein
MLKVLLSVDGSEASDHAVALLLKRLEWFAAPVEIHLLNVQPPLHGDIWGVLGKEKVSEHHREEGMAALRAARAKLDAAGQAYVLHIGVGNPADVIVHYAKERSCDLIVIGPRGLGAISGLLLGSVATKVLSLAHVPVLVLR